MKTKKGVYSIKKQLRHVCFVGVCIFLLSMPFASAKIPICRFSPMQTNKVTSLVDAPDWANGNFSGVWGITIFGVPTQPLGWIRGFYENIGLGKLEAEYASFASSNATSTLAGFMLWIFFMGGTKNISTGNVTWVSGLGVANETHYYIRLNTIVGPSYYMLVEYTKFDS